MTDFIRVLWVPPHAIYRFRKVEDNFEKKWDYGSFTK